jgi:hypothetical protein
MSQDLVENMSNLKEHSEFYVIARAIIRYKIQRNLETAVNVPGNYAAVIEAYRILW